ncbi:hypothetical protein HDU83_000978, partial [Entophlyctis luteolus]
MEVAPETVALLFVGAVACSVLLSLLITALLLDRSLSKLSSARARMQRPSRRTRFTDDLVAPPKAQSMAITSTPNMRGRKIAVSPVDGQ